MGVAILTSLFPSELVLKQAEYHGFNKNFFEKICTLSEILASFDKDPKISKSFALTGGTALNLFIFRYRRLSVDIDLDFAINLPFEEIQSVRDFFLELIGVKTKKLGLKLSKNGLRRSYRADSMYFSYKTSSGGTDAIKVDLNYTHREHIFPIQSLSTLHPLTGEKLSFPTLAPMEIFASKIAATIARGKPRDIYDFYGLITNSSFHKLSKDLLRKSVLFYLAISTSLNMEDITQGNRIKWEEQGRVPLSLAACLRREEGFNFNLQHAALIENKYLNQLLSFSQNEILFFELLRNKNEYRPELLFSDKEILSRLKLHPVAIWMAPSNKNKQERSFVNTSRQLNDDQNLEKNRRTDRGMER